MKLLCLGDLHGNGAALARILERAESADLMLLAGDLTNFGSPDEAEALVRQAGGLGSVVLAVAGNCDSAAIDRRLGELGVGLHGRGITHAGVGFHGLSAIPPWGPRMYQFAEDALAAVLGQGLAEIDGAARRVVLSHVPPHGGRLDRTLLGFHVGSHALRRFIDHARPQLLVCGHIHEARGVERLGATTVVNCGPARAGYHAVVELGNAADEIAVELRRA
jgi:uncharacterized protein